MNIKLVMLAPIKSAQVDLIVEICSQVKNINRSVLTLHLTHSQHTSLSHKCASSSWVVQDQKEQYLGFSYSIEDLLPLLGFVVEGEHILVLGLNLHDWYCSCIGLIFFWEKFVGFSPIWVSQDKSLCLLCMVMFQWSLIIFLLQMNDVIIVGWSE